MLRKLSSNKGISLLEILISLVIASIIVFAITSMVSMAIKTNKKSEVRQHATLLGQEIIEEIGMKDKIDEKELVLRGGVLLGEKTDDLIKYTNNNYEHDNNEYDVIVTVQKNNSLEYNHFDQVPIETNNKFYINKQSGIDKKLYILKDNEIDLEIPMTDEKNKTITVEFDKKVDKYIAKIGTDKVYKDYVLTDSKLVLNFTKDYLVDEGEEGITIKVINSTAELLNIYIQKSYECDERIYIEQIVGNTEVKQVRDKDESENSKMNSLYDITIEVKQNEKILFSSSINKNIEVIE